MYSDQVRLVSDKGAAFNHHDFHRQSTCLFIAHATHRGPYVLSVNDISIFLLTSFVIDVEVADLMKEVGVAFP